MKKCFYVLPIISLFFSCSTEPKEILVKREHVTVTNTKQVIADKMVEMEISGMSCEMGCGGSIRKALKETGGVHRVQYDFVEGRTKQTAKISFDSKLVNVDQMVKLIEELNDQQFSVGKTSSTGIK